MVLKKDQRSRIASMDGVVLPGCSGLKSEAIRSHIELILVIIPVISWGMGSHEI